MKILKNKKGFNDIFIIGIIIFIFFTTAIIIPFVNDEFETNNDVFDTDGLTQDVKDQAESVTSLSAFSILITVIKLGLFDFGNTLNLPFWLDGIYTVLAIIFLLVVGRNIWIGGGG